ncbi:serine/threonine-protein kinase HAL4/sat4 [Actinomortierella ambigua]|nr:serine/threonine-protein kinase HAL4/sat4 [Actinomortierella ambigua]
MVTFSTDYWAPAMDVHVRRRPEKNALSINPLSTYKHEDHWSTLRQVPTIDPHAATSSSRAVPSPHSLERSLSQQQRQHSQQPWTSRDAAGTASSSTTSKKQTLIHKIFHHENKSSASPPDSPRHDSGADDIDPFLASAGDGPLDKKNLFNFVSVLGRASSFSSDRSDTPVRIKADCSLLKKYGMCDKGNIGVGATAVVRLAHKLSEDDPEKLFAVKEFRKRRKNESEKEYVKKLTSEFCISSTLHHENVVETVDLVQDEQQHWCEVMEYCCGGDLYNIIKASHMTRIEIDCCFKQMINGVAYLHSMGVAHRDIKPENLLMDGQGRLKITDFGVSDVFRMCWENKPHLSKGLCGSEPYIAPEEFVNKEYDARRVDIWACIPAGPELPTFLEMRSLGAYEPLEKLPIGCRQLMKKILDPNPETRATIEDIQNDPWFKSIDCCVHGENLEPHRHLINQ